MAKNPFPPKGVSSGSKKDVGAKQKKLPPFRFGDKKNSKPGITLKKGDKA